MTTRSRCLFFAATLATTLAATPIAMAQSGNGPGVTATEIRIGNTMPYSGFASAYATIGKSEAAYFDKINAEGGVNGRKIKFISYDDALSPAKTVEQARKLVESDEVLLLFQSLGTQANAAIQKYMNTKKVPQLFVATGASRFGIDPHGSPWTMGWQPTYQSESRIIGKYIREKYPNGKVAVLWQNDDSGKDAMKGLRDGLGDKVAMLVEDIPYEVTDPTVDSAIVRLKNSGADVFILAAGPKQAAQGIRKVAELGWKPAFFLSSVSTSVATVLKPAGLENSKGLISSAYIKDPTDPAWKDDAETKTWTTFMDKYYPEGDKTNSNNVYGYAVAATMVQVLKQCGDDLSRDNVIKQAASLKDFTPPMILPGIKINTSPNDYFPIEQMQLMQFDGTSWKLFGDVITGEVSH